MEKQVVQPLLFYILMLMTGVGLNPFKQNFASKVLLVYTFLSILSLMALNLFYVVFNWQGVNSVDDLFTLPELIMVFAKWICLFVNNQKLFQIITKFNDEAWRLDKFGSEIQSKVSRPHRVVFKIFTFYIISGVCVSLSILLDSFLKEEYPLPYSTYEICNFRDKFCFYPIFVWEVLGTFWNVDFVIITFDGIFLALAFHAHVGIEMIKISLRKMTSTEGWKTRENMRDLINQHNYILNLIEDINELYSKILLIQFWGSLGCMIFALYMTTADSSEPFMNRLSNYGFLYLFYVMQLSLYCITGTYISEQSESIGNVAYDVDWLSEYDNDLRNALSMIIMRSQGEANISIGGMNHLNMETFVDVIKTSVSVYTLLNTLAETQE